MESTETPFKRQLVAILYADMVAYSRLTAQDEAGTHRALRQTLDVLSEHVERCEGTVVHFAGDAVLAKFNTITEALDCALKTQQQLSSLNRDTPPDKRAQIRVGVNLGDVIIDRDDIYGDGVNVAVRIQELADPGGICISGNVRDAVGGNLPIAYEYMGEQQVKNIDRPIRAFRVVSASTQNSNKVAAHASKPSIAVIRFDCIGNDDEGLSIGITEDISRELSRFKGLSVVALPCSQHVRDKAGKIQDVGTESGVDYVLKGTVQKTDSRVRIAAELIDAGAGQYLWADHYDKQSCDILDLQADTARTICATLGGRLRVAMQHRALSKPADRLDTYDYVLRGQALTGDTASKNREAEGIFARAIELDPGCARAYSGLAVLNLSQFLNDWADDPSAQLEAAVCNANKGIDHDDTDDKPHWLLGELKMLYGDTESAQMHLEKAMDLNPSDTDVYAATGVVQSYLSMPEQAVDNLKKAIAMNPYHPVWYLWGMGLALYLTGDYAAAVHPLREAIERKPDFFTPYQHLVAVYARLSRIADARDAARNVLSKNPRFCSNTVHERHLFQNVDGQENYFEALRTGGLEV
jgi:adenylate cyclase